MNRAAEIAKYSVAYGHAEYKMGRARYEAAMRDLAGLTGSLLDVGCGRGEVLRLAQDMGLSPVNGTEVVPALMGPGIVYAEAHDLPFPDRSYDHVTCFDVLEHLTPDDTVPALRELERVARRTVTVTVADYPHVFRGVDLHVNRRPYREWQALLEQLFGARLKFMGAAGASESWRITRPD
jgi:ubiquinone/menaquinone biosynthesis C-methylase UbiE